MVGTFLCNSTWTVRLNSPDANHWRSTVLKDANKVLIIELDGLKLLRNLLLSAVGVQELRQNYVAAIRKLVMKGNIWQGWFREQPKTVFVATYA